MKRLRSLRTASVLITILCVSSRFPVAAQEPMNSRDTRIPRLIAVIDMQKLLTDFPPFVSRLEELRKLQAAAQADIDKKRAELAKQRRHLDGAVYKRSKVYEEKLAEFFVEEAKLTAKQQTLDFRVAREETSLYVGYFRIAQNEIKKFAAPRGIGLVLNRSPISKDAQELDGAQALFGQKVVYEQQLDITNDILDRLEAQVKELPAVELETDVIP